MGSGEPRRVRLRDLGVVVGTGQVGPTNTIVDVSGVRVGHTTVSDAVSTFSGVTAVVVDGVSPVNPTTAGVFVGNGFGKLVGSTQIAELGLVETPVVLTSTLSVFRAADAIVTWVLRQVDDGVVSVNPVAAEVNDSWLSSPVRRPVTSDHVLQAIDGASTDAVELGSVGGGTGACALGFKGGIGSSSRRLVVAGREATLGVLVQANMDGRLRAFGRVIDPADHGLDAAGPPEADGSCVVLVAVDLPLDPNTLRRVAARAVYALARTGARFSHGSGDYGIALSSRPGAPRVHVSDSGISSVFDATMDAVEEAVIDALLAARTVRSQNGNQALALPVHALIGAAPDPPP